MKGAFLSKIALFLAFTCLSGVCGCKQEEGENSAFETHAPATVFTTATPPSPNERQTIYLWTQGNMPAAKGISRDESDPPRMESFPAQGEKKGCVLICAGGGFQFRSDYFEGVQIAQALAALGYQAFVVYYRLSPYTQEESALDLTRALRYVKKYATAYGVSPDDVALLGFSAGGILSGEVLLKSDGRLSPSALDPTYEADDVDDVLAEAAAVGMIYSFYGELLQCEEDVERIREGALPPTFYAYGRKDFYYSLITKNVAALKEAGVRVEERVFENARHGFGIGTQSSNWLPDFDAFLTEIFATA